MKFLTKPMYKLLIRIGFTKTVLHSKRGLVDSGAGPNLIHEDFKSSMEMVN